MLLLYCLVKRISAAEAAIATGMTVTAYQKSRIHIAVCATRMRCVCV